MIGRRTRPDGPNKSTPATPAVARLHRARWLTTLLFAATTAACLVVLAAVAVHTDAQSRTHRVDDDVTHRADGLARTIYYDDQGRLRLDGLTDDSLADGVDALGVVQNQSGTPAVRYAKPSNAALPDQAGLNDIWQTLQHDQETVLVTAPNSDGTDYRWAATPIYQGDKIDAAVLVGSDPARSQADHRKLTEWLAAGCAALVLVAAAVGHLLSGRSMRPALRGLEQQEQFLAEAAHELRTPLTALRLVVENGGSAEGGAPAALDEAVRRVDRMGRLVTGLLSRARIEAGMQEVEHTPLRLDQLVEQTVAELPDPAGITVDTEPVVVDGDPELLSQAVRNLVENALRHGGGTPVEVAVTAAGVAVRDHGPGVQAEDRERLFDRRVTGAGSSGTGTGLAIARWVAELHGGTAQLTDAPGGGALAELLLPPRSSG
ncbi:sensor histidine kinase [Catenulispora rubra]|uniref:sensor histidine kinase n=1 Tax=Catenulispora rubra TaxID=280293 RepID=UPI0018924056|nr:HAMP domain-containing sensor histidine kinase [Catenulispora rubra]